MKSDAPSHRAGIALLLASVLLISCSDTVAKLMTSTVAVMQIALFQSLAMMLAVPLLARDLRARGIFVTGRPLLQLTRSVCHLGSALCFFTGLKHLPLADMVAIIFIGPLLVTVLAALMLGEQVGIRRWVACVIGFTGALVVVRPGFGEMGWAALYPVGSTVLYSIYVICTRRTAPTESNAAMMLYAGLASVVVLSATSPWYWVAPTASGWLGLLTVAIISTTSAWLAIRAYALAPASLLAPYAYIEIVSATIFGFVVFSDVPDRFTVLGAGIIVASGLYVFRREH